MKRKNWFWGSFFLLAAVFVIASQTGSFGQIGIFSLVATILLVALMVESIFSRNFFGLFVPAAFLYNIYQNPLSLPDISIWLLVSAAVFAAIGFSILFRIKPKSHVFVGCAGDHHHYNPVVENVDDNNPSAKVNFSSASKYLHADCLKGGQFNVSFGSLEVYFDQAVLDPNGAEIFIECSFGAVKLYIPRSWRVVDKLQASLGGVENKNRYATPDPNSPVLTLTGNVSLGEVAIEYI